MKTCFFAGHRKLELTERLDKALDEELRRLLRCGVTQFCTGCTQVMIGERRSRHS